ncbi:hypothetical protein E2C01_058592 [Portunus trituberculatus]|uniref:Uncharacterized protein n=1 Tax=Portunus trituberculatus TaxID=210409 RepID=A0A5B7H4C5_PORTR|nr:hypothetical protein [Portunus trituberculatus]
MADSDVRGSEMTEGSERDGKSLKDLVVGLVQAMSEMKLEMSKIKQETSEISEIKQERSAVVMRMYLMREEMLSAVGEAKQFTVEHGKRLRQDLTEEFREELTAVRQQCKGRTEVVETNVEEVREEVTRLRRSLEKQSLGAWGRSECSEQAGQGHPYASSEPGNVGCCGGRTQSTHLWHAPAAEDDVITPPPSVAGCARHIGGTSIQRKPVEFGEQMAWEVYQAHLALLAQGQGWRDQEKALQLVASLCGLALEILAHMTTSQRSTYTAVAEALRRPFGRVFQAKV